MPIALRNGRVFTQTRMKPKEIFETSGDARYWNTLYELRKPENNGGRSISLSVLYEELDPSTHANYPDPAERSLGAFGRVLRAAGIRTKSDPVLGYWASKIEVFLDTANGRAQFAEFARREWVSARGMGRGRRTTLPTVNGVTDAAIEDMRQSGRASGSRLVASGDEVIGSALRPYVDAANVRNQQLEADISVAQIVANEAPIDGGTYRTIYISEPAADDIRFKRVTEHSEVPMAMISTSEHEINLFQYGRGIEISDQARRRGSIDKFALFLQQLAIQQEVDKFAHAIHVLVNGDGNAGTSATNYNLTTLDTAASAGTLTLKAWIRSKMLFNRGFALDVVVGREADILQLLLLNTGSANQPIVAAFGQGFGALTPLNRRLADGVSFAISDEAPSGKLVLLDTGQALERATEIGAQQQETERFVTRGAEALVLRETEGYSVIQQRATKLLNLAA